MYVYSYLTPASPAFIATAPGRRLRARERAGPARAGGESAENADSAIKGPLDQALFISHRKR